MPTSTLPSLRFVSMPSIQVGFANAQGLELAGRLDLPSGPARAIALFAHCFSCSKDLLAAGRIAQALNDEGFGVLRFDFAGLGKSAGNFSDTNFSSNVDDLVAAAAWLREHHSAPAVLVGHSLGGAAVVAAAHRLPEVRAVATIGAPSNVEHVLDHFADQLATIENEGEANVLLAGRPFRITRQFLDDAREQDIRAAVHTLGRPLLVMHAPGDTVVGIDNAAALYAAARHPKSFIGIDGADHLLTTAADARFAGSMIAAWASRYVERGAEPPPAPAVGILITESGVSRLQNWVVAANRRPLLADEPARVGGSDTGYGPFQWVAIGLAACTSMTLRLYADVKQMPLEHVEVAVTHSKRPAPPLDREATTAAGTIDVFDLTVRVRGSLEAEALSRLEAIANRCPVHKLLAPGGLVQIVAFERMP